ncbi:Protease HtpX [Gossypium australe]|uniref:Protease HtpX n=1 Tax=Gossypium australe TaxID=47621 RepID=A0A5B6V248_9ROSI|nr:Protease HtpX [Gossypium australe]
MMRRQEENHRHQDQQSRVFHELSALVLNLIRSPPMPFADQSPVPGWRSHPQYLSTTTISPAGYAWLMLGISVSLMLCGSVTFFIGFLLMPWVIGLFMVFYVAGIVSVISMLGRSILCYAMAPPPSPRKDIPALLLNFSIGCSTMNGDTINFDGIGIPSLKYDILLVGGLLMDSDCGLQHGRFCEEERWMGQRVRMP